MADHTHLDRAHAAMEHDGGEAARRHFYEMLAASELFVLLEGEAEGDQIVPQALEVEGRAFVLAFDTEERLAGFAGGAAAYVALSGRILAEMLAEQGLGLGLNLEAAPSAALLPPEAMTWLSGMLQDAPETVVARPREIRPPEGLPDAFLAALDARLASAGGLAEQACLVGVTYDSGMRGHLLGFIDAVPEAQPALARAVSEVVAFSGLEAEVLDVGFFRSSDPVAARMALVGLRFDLPAARI